MVKREKKIGKRITITVDESVQGYLDNQIQNSNFYNYQHIVEYCLKNLTKNNCIFLTDEIAEQIDSIINSGNVPYFNRQNFVYGCIKDTINSNQK